MALQSDRGWRLDLGASPICSSAVQFRVWPRMRGPFQCSCSEQRQDGIGRCAACAGSFREQGRNHAVLGCGIVDAQPGPDHDGHGSCDRPVEKGSHEPVCFEAQECVGEFSFPAKSVLKLGREVVHEAVAILSCDDDEAAVRTIFHLPDESVALQGNRRDERFR